MATGTNTLINIVIGVLIFSGIITFGGMMYMELADNSAFNVSHDSDYNVTFNKINSSLALSNQLGIAARSGEGNQSQSSTIDQLLKSGYNSISYIWNSYGIVQDVAEKTQEKLHLNSLFFNIFMIIFIITVAITIISILLLR